MGMNYPVMILNLTLCAVIVILGLLAYKKSKHAVTLYVTIAFGLFGVSHLLSFWNMGGSMENTLLAIRTVGYLTVIAALFKAK